MSGDGEERAGGRGRRRTPRPLDEAMLGELALAYVARFATSRSKLSHYLSRKLRERGWAGSTDPDVPTLVERLAGQGFIDDRAFAEARAGGLLRRGYGSGRVRLALSAAGIAEEDRASALENASAQAQAAALRFAERRRIGPFAAAPLDQPARAKALAAMVRAGHGFDLSRRIVDARPEELENFDPQS